MGICDPIRDSRREVSCRMLEDAMRGTVDAYWKSTREDIRGGVDSRWARPRMWDVPRTVLAEWAKRAEHPDLFRESVVVLALEHWDDDTAALLLRILESPRDSYQAFNVAVCLALRGRPEGIPTLLEVLPADPRQPYPAQSSSGIEVGLSALALAVLDESSALPALRRYRDAVNARRMVRQAIETLEARGTGGGPFEGK